MYKAIVFDLDGTIIDTEPAVFAGFQKTLRELGRDYAPEDLYFSIGMPSEQAFETLGFNDIPACLAVYEANLKVALRNISIFDGMRETLAALTVPLGLVTSETRAEMQVAFYDMGLSPYFAHTVSADDVERRKPHPDPLVKCLELLGCRPEDALYVGDTAYDMRCADSAGVDFALATWGAHTTEGLDRVNYTPRRPSDILKLLTRPSATAACKRR